MPDREKVVEGLKKVWDAFNAMEHELYADYVFDALELLKPVEAEMEGGGNMWYPVCGECHGYINDTWKFCPECGRSVKWE